MEEKARRESSQGSYSADQKTSPLKTALTSIKQSSCSDDGQSPVEGENDSSNIRASLATKHGTTDETLSGTSMSGENLVDWFTDTLHQYLQKIVAKRKNPAIPVQGQPIQFAVSHGASVKGEEDDDDDIHVLDKIADCIDMPDFDEGATTNTGESIRDPTMIELGCKVQEQLKQFVVRIAAAYRDHAFHNFEHASHVALSANKILKKIHVPIESDNDNEKPPKRLKIDSEAQIRESHDASFGISSDPLMQFAVLFAALIHDMDHTGLTNEQLIQNHDPLASQYLGRSMAEQHSIRCAWDILMADQFSDLRWCIYQTENERRRFRQLVINAVIATDIADARLQARRQTLWIEAFQNKVASADNDSYSAVIGRKAILVFELIIQASDSAHTMQHWQIYQKWNQRLFSERYAAHVTGKALAKTFSQCQAFESLSADFVTCTLSNRQEWKENGEKIVSEMVQQCQGKAS